VTRVVLIRHGQTRWNRVERIRGQVDIPLDDVGMAQAEATGRRVAEEWKPAAVYSSPLRRAVQTAQPLARLLGQKVQLEEGFNDLNFGEWQGLSPQEVKERWPGLAETWLTAPHLVAFPEGESLDLVRKRSGAALHKLIDRHEGRTIALVGHNALNRVMLCYILGIHDANYWRVEQCTCAVNVFRWRDGIFYIESLNDTCHLRPLQPSTAERAM